MDTEEDNDIDIDIDIDIDNVAATSGTSARVEEAAQPTVDPDVLKRRAIIQIRNDPTIDEQTKRFRMQQLMDGSNRSQNNEATTSQGIAAFRSSSIRRVGSNNGVTTCVHYPERKCNIIAPCCGEIFGCRICHDEQVTDGHEINRFDIREVVCKECNTRQERS